VEQRAIDRAAEECFREALKPVFKSEDDKIEIAANTFMDTCMKTKGYGPTLDCTNRVRNMRPLVALGYKSGPICWQRN